MRDHQFTSHHITSHYTRCHITDLNVLLDRFPTSLANLSLRTSVTGSPCAFWESGYTQHFSTACVCRFLVLYSAVNHAVLSQNFFGDLMPGQEVTGRLNPAYKEQFGHHLLHNSYRCNMEASVFNVSKASISRHNG